MSYQLNPLFEAIRRPIHTLEPIRLKISRGINPLVAKKLAKELHRSPTNPDIAKKALQRAYKLSYEHPKRNWLNPGAFDDILGIHHTSKLQSDPVWKKTREILTRQTEKDSIRRTIRLNKGSTIPLDSKISFRTPGQLKRYWDYDSYW